jgi:O-antigen ligase
MTADSTFSVRLYGAALLGLAALVGFLAGIDPVYAVGAAVGSVFAVVVLADLALGVCVFTTVVFVEALPGFGSVSAAKALGGLLVLSWVASLAYRRRGVDFPSAHPMLSAGLIVMVVWTFASSLWSREPGLALTAAQSWTLNAVLVPIVFTALKTPKDFGRVFGVFAIGTLISALYGVVGTASVAETPEAYRLAGAGINANQLGGVLIIGTVFAGILAARRQTAGRGIWLAIAIFCGVALAYTLSRGALVGMAVCLIVAPFLAGRGRRLPILAGGLLALMAVVLSIAVLIPSTETKRLFSDASGSGRTDIWQVGVRMVKDNPVLGVGAANFQENTIRYTLQKGVIQDDYFLVDLPKVPHNIYLQAWAELGVIGLVLFLGLVGTMVGCALRAARNFARAGARTPELYARGCVIASIGFLAFEFFSSQMYSKALWLLLALGPALLAMSRDPDVLRSARAAR